MSQNNATRFLSIVKQDRALKERIKATSEPEVFIKIAKDRGYDFTVEELQTELSKLSEEELAAIVNPGIAPRQHIYPR
jgi:predicted ribosomally synthesized peptide with nif11-like leader